MGMKEKLLVLITKLNEYPEIKIKIMWFLDYMPMIKKQLKKINHGEAQRGIECVDDLSPLAKEIYQQIKSKGL